MYWKKSGLNNELPKLVDLFETLFTQLDVMGSKTATAGLNKVALLIHIMEIGSVPESTTACTKTRNTDQLSM